MPTLLTMSGLCTHYNLLVRAKSKTEHPSHLFCVSLPPGTRGVVHFISPDELVFKLK